MTTRKNKGMRAVAAEADKVTTPIRQKRGLAEAALVSDWPDIIGSALAAECMPLRIANGPDGTGGTLHIRVSGTLALELQHLQPQVIERINSYFGYHAIARITLQQGPVRQPARRAKPAPSQPSPQDINALSTQLDQIEDEDLRRALDALGRGILTKKISNQTK